MVGYKMKIKTFSNNYIEDTEEEINNWIIDDNIKEIKNLKAGITIYHKNLKNADGSAQRFKITSIKLWKTRPDKCLVGLKRGLYEFYKINELELDQFHHNPI